MDPDGDARSQRLPAGNCALTLKSVSAGSGTIVIDPTPADANVPAYPAGTVVTLRAIPSSGKSFVQWEISGTGSSDDPNDVIIDANATTSIVMNGDRQVTAVFRCGMGLGALPLSALALVALMILRRRA